jgi:hypothetical protein
LIDQRCLAVIDVGNDGDVAGFIHLRISGRKKIGLDPRYSTRCAWRNSGTRNILTYASARQPVVSLVNPVSQIFRHYFTYVKTAA